MIGSGLALIACRVFQQPPNSILYRGLLSRESRGTDRRPLKNAAANEGQAPDQKGDDVFVHGSEEGSGFLG